MQNFTPILSQAIPHPEYDWLLFRGFARDALGLKDAQENTLRKQLREGYDWIKLKGTDHILRIFYTPQGISELCCKVGGDRAMAFLKSAATYRPTANAALVIAQPEAIHPWRQPAAQPLLYEPERIAPHLVQPEPFDAAHPPAESPMRPHMPPVNHHHYYLTVQAPPAAAPSTLPRDRSPSPPEPTQHEHRHLHVWSDPGGFFNWLGVSLTLVLVTFVMAFIVTTWISNSQPRRVNIRLEAPQPHREETW